MAKGQLIAGLDFSDVAEDEFNDWYDLEHLPERQRVSGFLGCQRWISAENPKQSVATYDLDNLAVLKGDGYRAIGENLSPWSKRITSRCPRRLRFEGEQILPGDSIAPENAGGLLLVGMTPPPDDETAFNAWYDTEHVPALARVPGVLSARRFRAGSTSGPKYIALYHLASPEIVTGPDWKRASESTPMPQPIRPRISDRVRLVCRSYRRQG